MKVLAVTGCLGFLGAYLIEALIQRGYYVYGYDAETYAANTDLLETWGGFSDIFRYQKADIVEMQHLPDVDAVVNLAAETHVDSSTMDARAFVRTNVLGVHNLLELVRAKRNYQMPRFLQVSTDEVYGDVAEGQSAETAPLRPSSPYAASKAAADLLVQAYARTHGITYNLVRPSNLFGARQYPEKLIPKTVRYLKFGKPMPLHAGGAPVRSWLHVEDGARAILTVLESGVANETYNVGGVEASVEGIVGTIASCLGVQALADERFQRDGLDLRYAVDDTKLRALGWTPQGDLWRDLPRIVAQEQATFRW